MSKALFTIVLLAASAEYIGPKAVPLDSVSKSRSPYEAIDQNIIIGESRLFWSPWNACGQVAVFAVCDSLDMAVSLDEIASHIRVGEKGSSMKSLVEYLTSLGLEASGAQTSADALLQMLNSSKNARAIVLVDGSHWVAVLGSSTEGVELFSYPNRVAVDAVQFGDRYSGKAVILWKPRVSIIPSEFAIAAGTSVASIGSVIMLVFGLRRKDHS